MSVIDHLEIAVTDAELSRQFYQQALAPLGFRLVINVDPANNRTGGFRHGLGPDGYPRFWLHDSASTVAPVHVVFSAQERATVDQFWAAAIQAGGKVNGAPGGATITTTIIMQPTFWILIAITWKSCVNRDKPKHQVKIPGKKNGATTYGIMTPFLTERAL